MQTTRPTVQITFVDPETIDESAGSIPTHMAARGRIFALGNVLALVVVAVYGIALQGGFIFLDDLNVVDNLALRSWGRGFSAIWSHPTILPHYQPLWYSLLQLQFKLFSLKQPGGYLAVNVILHVCNVLLLWTLLRKLEIPGALLAALIFAVHPVNVEAVAWISQQSILLSSFFSLITILLFLRARSINPPPVGMYGWLRLPESNWVLLVLAIVLHCAAVGSHPMAISVPLVLAGVIWWERGRINKQDIAALAPLVLISIIWLTITLVADHRRASSESFSFQLNASYSVMSFPGAIWRYLLHVVFPFGLSFGYSNSVSSQWAQISSALGITGVIGLLWIARRRLGRTPATVGLIFFAALLPAFLVQTDLRRYSASVSDHIVYFPAIVVLLAIAAAVARWRLPAARWIKPIMASAVIVTLSILALLRIPDYRSSDNLWAAALRCDPNSVLAHNQIGLIELTERNDTSAAMGHFFRALTQSPDDIPTRLNIAQAYISSGEIDKARMAFQEAAVMAPGNAQVHFGLATALARQHQNEAAKREYLRAIQLQSVYPVAYANLGLIYSEEGDFDAARAAYHAAMKLNPNLTVAHINLANMLFERGVATGDSALIEEAANTLESAVAIDPANFGLYLNAGAMTTRLAQGYAANVDERKTLLHQAERFFRKAVDVEPSRAEGYANLAVVLQLEGRIDDAVFAWGRAAAIQPENAQIAQSLERAKLAAADARPITAHQKPE